MCDDNVQTMWQLLHELPCPACGSALAVHVDDGTLTLGAGPAGRPALEPAPGPTNALEEAWARFVASSASLDD